MKNVKETVMNVVVERLEGLHEECIEIKVNSIKSANKVLAKLAKTAPTGGAYDKTKFTIRFRDGGEYTGRYDLVHISEEQPNLQKHVTAHLEFIAGVAHPSHMTEDEYRQHLDLYNEATKKEAQEFLQTYEIA